MSNTSIKTYEFVVRGKVVAVAIHTEIPVSVSIAKIHRDFEVPTSIQINVRLFSTKPVTPGAVAINAFRYLLSKEEISKLLQPGQMSPKTAEHLAHEEAERQARARTHRSGTNRPVGMSGNKTSMVTRPDSKKAQKQARRAQNARKGHKRAA